MNTEERFLNKIKVNEATGCWEWIGCTDGRYGIFHFPGFYKGYRMAKAHHVALFLIKNIQIESDKEVLHSCDNTICCNPDHLSVGTHFDNMQDMSMKGRSGCSNQKLTTDELIEAKKLRGQGFSVKSIAEKFKLSPSQMSRLVKGCFRKGIKGIDL